MENLQLPLLWAMLCLYVGAFMLYAFSIWAMKPQIKRLAHLVTIIAFSVNTVLIIIRAILIKGIPLNNGFEFGLCFAFALILIFLILEFEIDLAAVGIFVLPMAVALSCWLVNIDMGIHPVMPALRSYWLSFHVSAAVISYGAFALSFAVSVAYLVKERAEKKGAASRLSEILPPLSTLDEVAYKMVFIGLPFLTIMLITGAVWAEYTWGTFWSWDPKETWALITWLAYALYLHARFMRGSQGHNAAILSIIGFAAVVFTFIGVSYLLPGMHSYLVEVKF